MVQSSLLCDLFKMQLPSFVLSAMTRSNFLNFQTRGSDLLVKSLLALGFARNGRATGANLAKQMD